MFGKKLSSFQNNFKLQFFFIHPIMLALYGWIIIIYFTPNYFDKYNAGIVNSYVRKENDKYFYSDLNGDGKSEVLRTAYHPTEGNSLGIPFILYSDINSKTINEHFVIGNWLSYFNVYFDDFDSNDFQEVYFLTRQNDSIFLNIKELMHDNGLNIQHRFVCKTSIFKNNINDVRDVDATFIDLNDDGYKEFIFSLRGGYSKFPRNTFSYNIVEDSLEVSPQSASGFLNKYSLKDINNDGITEITSYIPANENIHYEMPYTDSCSWLMVINPVTMDFKFPPVMISKGIGSSIYPVFNSLNDSIYITARSYCNTITADKHYLELMVFDINGNLINKKEAGDISKNEVFDFIDLGRNSHYFYLISNRGNIYKTDLGLELTEILNIKSDITDIFHNGIRTVDADADGINEFIFIGYNNQKFKLLIYNNDFSNCTSVDLDGADGDQNWIVNQIKGKSKPMFYVQAGKYAYTLTYAKSPYYYLKYPVYLLIYLILLIIFWALQKAQNRIAAKALEEEKLLMKQQMALSKKQLEPHFMLNTLNNIGNMFAKEDKEDAQYYFGKFSSLLHRGLIYANKTETTMHEELEFVSDYLVLQKRRYLDLGYTIEVDESINLDEINIPHSLVYTFVENALKHGLRNKEGKKDLGVFVYKRQNNFEIIIRDNGVGRKISKQYKENSTGKGLTIIANIIKAYNKLNNRKITFEIMDLKEGVEVKIFV